MRSAEEETSSEVLKSKPDKFTSEVLKTNYSSVVCHSSALSIRYFPPPFVSVVYYLLLLLAVFVSFNVATCATCF